MNKNNTPLLRVRMLKKYFPIHTGFFNKVSGYTKAVDGVSFDLYEGKCLGLVGESGSGKTTTGRVIMRAYRPTSGEIILKASDGIQTDIARTSEKKLKDIRRNMQMIFQDPYSSLNPRMTVMDIVSEPLLNYGMKNRKQRRECTLQLLEKVGLNNEHMNRYPHAFSGGQRQRIGIARALALNPRLIVADEPVSALDVSVQAQILNLMVKLQKELNLSYLFITHDLRVVKHICDTVAVMYQGKIVELTDVEQLFNHPAHPYTRMLIDAIPEPTPKAKQEKNIVEQEVSTDYDHQGCPFYARCDYRKDQCIEKMPQLERINADREHLVMCHEAQRLQLKPYL